MTPNLGPMLAEQRARLLGVLGRVSGDWWGRPTVSDPWTVKDVVAHLVEKELDFGRLLRGERSELLVADALDDEAVERWRALPGAAVRGALWQHGTATQRVVDSMPVPDWARAVRFRSSAGPERTAPIGDLIWLHLLELTVHGRDLTEALGAPPHWDPVLPALVAEAARVARATLSAAGTSGSIRLTVEGAGSWILSPNDVAEVDERALPSVQTNAATVVLSIAGRLAPEEVRAGAACLGATESIDEVLLAWRAC